MPFKYYLRDADLGLYVGSHSRNYCHWQGDMDKAVYLTSWDSAHESLQWMRFWGHHIEIIVPDTISCSELQAP